MTALSPAVEEFLESRKARRIAKLTIVNERSVLHQLVADIGNIQVHNISGGHIDTWLSKRSYKAPTTRNRDVDIVRGFFQWCRDRGYMRLNHNPLSGVGRLGTELRERIFVPSSRFGEALEAADSGRDRISVAIQAYTLLRNSDMARLRVRHAHVDNPDPKKWHLQVWRKKTKTYDDLPVMKRLAHELRRWRLDYSAQVGQHLDPDWFLVPAFHKSLFQPGDRGRLPARTINPKAPYQRPWEATHRVLKVLGHEDTFMEGGHTWRRSGGLALYDKLSERGHDGSMRIPQSMLGHASLRTTEIYLRIDSEKKRRNELLAGEDLFDEPESAEVIQLAAQEG